MHKSYINFYIQLPFWVLNGLNATAHELFMLRILCNTIFWLNTTGSGVVMYYDRQFLIRGKAMTIF